MPRKNSLSSAEIESHPPARRIEGGLFSLSVWKLSGTSSKFACVVSKKVAIRAPDRNLIKRRCREAARAFITTTPSSLAIVAHARKQAANASAAAIREDINKLLQSCK